MADALTFKSVEEQVNFKFTFVINSDSKVITDADKKKLATEAKKLAKHCCCGDEDYGCWITDKFSKFTTNTEAIFFVNARNKSKVPTTPVTYKDSYAVGIKVKKPTKDKFKIKDTKVPAMCDSVACNPIPLAWKNGSDDLSITIGGKDGPAKFDLLQAKETRKVKFCFKDMLQAQLFLVSEIFVKYFTHSDFIMNSFMNKQNYLMLNRTGMVDLKLRYSAPKPVHLQLNGVNLELPVDCDYLKLPKANKDGIKNLVMYPEIENFYIENENLVGNKNCSSLRSISNIYEIAQRKSGFFYSCSSDYYISQFKVSQGAITFAADFESLQSLITKNTAASGTAFDKIIEPLFADKKPFLISQQPNLFVSYTATADNVITKKLEAAIANKDAAIVSEADEPEKPKMIKETTLKDFLKNAKKGGGGGGGGGSFATEIANLKTAIDDSDKLTTNATNLIKEINTFNTTELQPAVTVALADKNARKTEYLKSSIDKYDQASKVLVEASNKTDTDTNTDGESREDLIKLANQAKTAVSLDVIGKDVLFEEEQTIKTEVENAASSLFNLNSAVVAANSEKDSDYTKAKKTLAKVPQVKGDIKTATKQLVQSNDILNTAYQAAGSKLKDVKDLVERLKNSTAMNTNRTTRDRLITEFMDAATAANFD
jgi:hypothetical protein